MPVDFQAEGLLDDRHNPRGRAERIALLDHLLHRGVPLEDLRRAAAEGRLVLLAVERALDATGEGYAPTDVSARTGFDVEAVRRLRASFGLAVPAATERGLGEPDVAAAAEHAGFPQLRAGLAQGTALARGGDWFGGPVNLASRICDVTPPGAILASANVKDACPSARWAFAGAERLKGIPEPVPLWRPELTAAA